MENNLFLGFMTHEAIICVLALYIIVSAITYSCLDGFDLGICSAMFFVPSEKTRTRMIWSVLPYWDGHETWIVLTIGGLIATFPLAYSYYLQAAYIPIILMLMAIGARGICLEFRIKSPPEAINAWDKTLAISSYAFSFCQGLVAGVIINGIAVDPLTNDIAQYSFMGIFHIVPFVIGFVFIGIHMQAGMYWIKIKLTKEDNIGLNTMLTVMSCFYAVSIILAVLALICTNSPIISFAIENNRAIYVIFLLIISTSLPIIMRFIYFHRNINNLIYVFISFLTITLFFLAITVAMFPMMIFPNISMFDAAISYKSSQYVITLATVMVPIIIGYTMLSHFVMHKGMKRIQEKRYSHKS